MDKLPLYFSISFMLITLLTVVLFYRATKTSVTTLIVLLVWLALQTILGLSEFYMVTNNIPPRFSLAILPPIIFIIIVFATARGRKYIDSLDLKKLTILHTIRIPVELVLLGLCIHKTIPQLMTFEGINFDILSGLTAPLIFYFGFIKNKVNRNLLIIWNIICLGLLFNIVVNAILAAPFPFQQFAFDQPNVAVLYFPFVWLPACVVPLVLFSHLAAIRQLIYTEKKIEN